MGFFLHVLQLSHYLTNIFTGSHPVPSEKKWYYFAVMIELCSPIFDFSQPKIAKSTLSLIFSRTDFLIRNFPSSFCHPHFFCPPSLTRPHPFLVFQRPLQFRQILEYFLFQLVLVGSFFST